MYTKLIRAISAFFFNFYSNLNKFGRFVRIQVIIDSNPYLKSLDDQNQQDLEILIKKNCVPDITLKRWK